MDNYVTTSICESRNVRIHEKLDIIQSQITKILVQQSVIFAKQKQERLAAAQHMAKSGLTARWIGVIVAVAGVVSGCVAWAITI